MDDSDASEWMKINSTGYAIAGIATVKPENCLSTWNLQLLSYMSLIYFFVTALY